MSPKIRLALKNTDATNIHSNPALIALVNIIIIIIIIIITYPM